VVIEGQFYLGAPQVTLGDTLIVAENGSDDSKISAPIPKE
jgi:hypothetical protein